MELKNCPFCGQSESVQLVSVPVAESEQKAFSIVCDELEGGCGACMSPKDSIAEAIESWNKRAPNPFEMHTF